MPPRALQERSKRLLAGITHLSCNQELFLDDFGLHKEASGPQKSRNFVRRPQSFVVLPFSARVASGIRFWTLLASLLGSFWLPRWLKPLLENLSERPRAVSNNVFSVPRASKSAPRGKKEPSGRHHATQLQSEAILYRF